MVKRRDAFTLFETLMALLIVTAFCGLAAMIVQYAVASKQTQGLGIDRFGWYLGTNDLAEYLHDKTVVSIGHGGDVVKLSITGSQQATHQLNTYRNAKGNWQIRAQNQSSEGHEPIVTNLADHQVKFSLVSSRLLRVRAHLPNVQHQKGVIYEIDLPIAGALPPRHDPPDRAGPDDSAVQPAGNDRQPRRQSGPGVARTHRQSGV